MGSEIRVESTAAIQAMIDAAAEGYERAKTFYEARREMLARLIAKILAYLEKFEGKLHKALSELGHCQQEIARVEVELASARRAQSAAAGDGKEGSIRMDLAALKVAELERRLAELHDRKKVLEDRCEYLRQVVGQCKEQLADANALKKDWEDRGRAALERTRRDSERQQDIGNRQLAAIADRPYGR